jgi:hypothetical protein
VGWSTSVTVKKPPKINNPPLDENSPNLFTLKAKLNHMYLECNQHAGIGAHGSCDLARYVMVGFDRKKSHRKSPMVTSFYMGAVPRILAIPRKKHSQ